MNIIKHISYFILIISTSCVTVSNSDKKTEISKLESSTVTQSNGNLNDSLFNINFFDFYNKPLKKLLENDILNQYDNYSPVFDYNECLNHIELRYRNNNTYLRVYFSNTHGNRFCFEREDSIQLPINYLLREKILTVGFPRELPISMTDSKEEEDVFINNFKKINIEEYSDKPIDDLISVLPKLKKRPYISFHDEEGCLYRVLIIYRLVTREIGIYMYPKDFKQTPKCLDLNIEHWNFNDFRKETLERVEIYGL